jgi:hypothetical protein
VTRRPVVYHIIAAGRRHVSAASGLVLRERRVAVELDPQIVQAKGVFVEIDPRKLRTLDEEGWVFGYPELVDRRTAHARRRHYQPEPPRGPGRRKTDAPRREQPDVPSRRP